MTPHTHRVASRRPPVRSLGIALTALVLGLSLFSCSRGAGGGGRGGFQMPPAPVEVAEVRPQVVRDQFRTLGSIEAQEIVQVTSEVSGIVRRIGFAEGQAVRQGAPIASLEDREEAAEAERAAAQRDLANQNFTRASRLAEQNVISAQELDNARANLRVAEASANVASARLAQRRIRAPFSGLAGRRLVSPGTYLRAGDPVTELARVDRLRVTFSAPERYLEQLHRGASIAVTTPAFPGQTFTGRITVVDPIVDAATRSVKLVAELPNPGYRLKPGMSANVAVTFEERPQALVVPDEAVFAEGAQSFVYVVKPDSTVTRTAVRLGLRDSSRVEITEGLTAGQTVVTAGHQKVFEGARVMPLMAGSMGPGGPPAAAGAAKPAGGAAARPAAASGRTGR